MIESWYILALSFSIVLVISSVWFSDAHPCKLLEKNELHNLEPTKSARDLDEPKQK